MQSKFLIQFYDQLFKTQLKNCQNSQPLFYYIEVLTHVCQRIKQVCNNSRTAILVFCQYLTNKLMIYQLQMPSNPQHQFLQCLKIQENYVVYFTQIAVRLFLLSYFCKLGEEGKRKEWKIGILELFKQARIQFMFNYSNSLADAFVEFFDKVQQVCNEVPFYEKLIKIFEKQDMDFVSEKLRQKIAKNKQNWLANINKNKQLFTPLAKSHIKNTETSKDIQKSKNVRKSVKIVAQSQKIQPDENLRNRISDFRQNQKKRLSQHHQSGKRRTIFQYRRHVTKCGLTSPASQESSQMFFDDAQLQNQNIKQYGQQTVQYKELEAKIQKETARKNNPNLFKPKIQPKIPNQTFQNGNFIVAGTPPRKKTSRQQ